MVRARSKLTLLVNIGSTSKRICVLRGKRVALSESLDPSESIRSFLEYHELATIDRIGIRIVCPGSFFQAHRRIDSHYFSELKRMEQYAPLHAPAIRREIVRLKKDFSDAHLYGISDSALYHDVAAASREYAIDIRLARKYDLFRFGYHGLSVASLLKSLRLSSKKCIILHLGGGCSAVAVHNGRVVDMSMGFSPLEGIMGASRSGDIDPAAVLYLREKLGKRTLDTLNSRSGFMGIGGSSDLRSLLTRRTVDPHARLAIDSFVASVRRYIGAYAALMGGVDCIVFTGAAGVGSAFLRREICRSLGFLGVEINSSINRKIGHIDDCGSLGVDIAKKGKGFARVRVATTGEISEMARVIDEIG